MMHFVKIMIAIVFLFLLVCGCNNPSNGDGSLEVLKKSTVEKKIRAVDSIEKKILKTPAKRKSAKTKVTRMQQERLANLGYITSKKITAQNTHKNGVTKNEKQKTANGVNVYCSENSGVLNFLDMNGKFIHRVTLDNVNALKRENKCKTVGFDQQGNFVMVVEQNALVKSDLQGNVLWRLPGMFHHDLDVMAEGTVYAIANSKSRISSTIDSNTEIVDNVVVKVSSSGKIERMVSLLQLMRGDPELVSKAKMHVNKPRYDSVLNLKFLKKDIFHTNTIEVIREDVKINGKPFFKKGQVLLCSRHLDTIWVVDLEKKKIVWKWGLQELQWPHHPSILEDGSIMIFDNGIGRGKSRVIIMSPVSGKITRVYQSDDFFSRTRGGAQQLKNGNLLICDSEKGRVFEVDENDNVVWEFWNPDRNIDQNKRATVFRFERLYENEHSFLSSLISR